MTAELRGEDRQDGALDEYERAVSLIGRLRSTSSGGERPSVRHWVRATDKVSADFFCLAEHPKFGWFGLLADAAGHGLSSAIFALHLPMLFREAVTQGLSIAAIYTRLHRFLVQQGLTGHFVCAALVRVHERKIEIINAGMPDILLLAKDGRLAEAFPSQLVPLGVNAGTENEDIFPQRYRLARGESAALLLYSDGLVELGVLTGAAFGRDGVMEAASAGAEAVFDRLVASVEARPGDTHDDVSLALIPVPLDSPADECEEELPEAEPVGMIDDAAARRIVEGYDRGLLLTDQELRIVYVNPKFSEITGYRRDEALGQTPRLLNSGRHGAEFYRKMWQAVREAGHWSGEIWNRRKDGSLYLEWLDIRVLTDTEGQPTHYLGVFTVITQQKAQEERMKFLALHDPLTGLANRILLGDRGKQAIVRADRVERALAVLFVDLDRFKAINDSHGHDVGDEVLVRVAERMQTVLREDDTLCRFGGDEFVCLLPDIAERHDAGMVANKLLAALDKPFEVAGHRFKINASIGVSAYPSDGQDFDELVVRADRAMLRAKQAGGNMTRFFSAEMAVSAERQLEIETRLDAAIKSGHLELFYQPKLDLVTRRIIGAEALVRWRDPRDGLISPGVFIPVAERSDLIARIGNWVMTEACRVIAQHQDVLPEDFHIAINVSPIQLERCDLAGEVARAVDAAGIPAYRLQLEVTESLIIRDTNSAADTLQRIVDLGGGIALDDFGTGYSNLASLAKLPIDTFKLDQSFVRGIDRDGAKASIARSVWHLADGLGKKVVAEGVESCEECIKLQSIGYDIGQGYRFGKPMPEAEFFAFLADWKPDNCQCPVNRPRAAEAFPV